MRQFSILPFTFIVLGIHARKKKKKKRGENCVSTPKFKYHTRHDTIHEMKFHTRSLTFGKSLASFPPTTYIVLCSEIYIVLCSETCGKQEEDVHKTQESNRTLAQTYVQCLMCWNVKLFQQYIHTYIYLWYQS